MHHGSGEGRNISSLTVTLACPNGQDLFDRAGATVFQRLGSEINDRRTLSRTWHLRLFQLNFLNFDNFDVSVHNTNNRATRKPRHCEED